MFCWISFFGKIGSVLTSIYHFAKQEKTTIRPSYLDNNVFYAHKHYSDVIMNMMASQITSFIIVYSIVYSDADQRKYQSSASPTFVRGIHQWPVNSPHKCIESKCSLYLLLWLCLFWWRNQTFVKFGILPWRSRSTASLKSNSPWWKCRWQFEGYFRKLEKLNLQSNL